LATILIALVGWLAIRRPGRKTQRGYESIRNPGAHEAYLRGVTFWNKRTREGMTRAIGYFQQAIQLDQRYALAYSGLADSYFLSGYYGFLPSADAYTLAESPATVAVGIDDNVAAAHTVLALVKIEHQDPKGAESELERAITVQPDYSTAHQRYAWFLL
jgi:tetratricopeptide (TPR) repeat protein